MRWKFSAYKNVSYYILNKTALVCLLNQKICWNFSERVLNVVTTFDSMIPDEGFSHSALRLLSTRDSTISIIKTAPVDFAVVSLRNWTAIKVILRKIAWSASNFSLRRKFAVKLVQKAFHSHIAIVFVIVWLLKRICERRKITLGNI